MDLWVVAAAAGAGYVAKNLQNLSLDKKESPGGSSYKYSYNCQSDSRNFLQQLRDRTCPLRRLARKRAQDDSFLDLENHSDAKFSGIDPISNRGTETGAASTSAYASEETVKFGDGENRNFSKVKGGKIITSRRCRGHPMKPLNSLGSSFDSQLCRERENMELDNTCLYPSLSTVRPVLVTDGGRLMSRSGSNSSFGQCEGCKEEETLRENGVPGRSFHSQGSDSMHLFITGVTIGILSATTSWKNEVDKLNKQLKQMESLVQDLHEELDMKEMLMVKDLTDAPREIHTPPSTHEPIASPSEVKVNKFTKSDSLKANDRNVENLELLSKIEAELQAELEMLEHNMKASTLERISSVVEIDPDFEPEIVEGDLKPVMANCMSESENGTSYTRTNCSQPANYAVSPWELSLRLHELIESRLETRIKDLQIALDNSQKLVQFLGSQSIVSGTKFSHSETEVSSTHQTPTRICDDHDKRQDGPSTDNISSHYMDALKDPNGISLRETDKDQEKANRKYDSISHHSFLMEEDRSLDLVQDMSNEESESEDEGTDESEMLLIKQIVERSRSGSSFNLKI